MAYRDSSPSDSVITFIIVVVAIGLVIGLLGAGCYVWPKYNVYSSRMSGEAQLAEAESNRRITILEAQSKKQAAISLAQVDSLRAGGVAAANRIIGHSLRDNPEYLTWLWIEALKDGQNDVVYVPTEANLPITEAGRLRMRAPHDTGDKR